MGGVYSFVGKASCQIPFSSDIAGTALINLITLDTLTDLGALFDTHRGAQAIDAEKVVAAKLDQTEAHRSGLGALATHPTGITSGSSETNQGQDAGGDDQKTKDV